MDYYNEIDPYCAQWLQNLMDANVIGKGVIDTRSIEDVTVNDLRGHTQVHFFAGIGVWSYALRQAGWPVDRPVWTGSCPCQPFSAAGKGGGVADERHLWPAWLWLIRGSRPDRVFGEQVSSKDGLAWLDVVSDDMAGEGYSFGPMDICSASVGAPNIRQRQYFAAVADTHNERLERRDQGTLGNQRASVERGSHIIGLADTDGGHAGAERQQRSGQYGQQPENGITGDLANAPSGGRREECSINGRIVTGDRAQRCAAGPFDGSIDLRPGPTNGFWREADWLFCRDDKWRPVEPGTFPLASGIAGRVGRLRAYGNAINAEVAIAWIESFLEVEADGFVEVD